MSRLSYDKLNRRSKLNPLRSDNGACGAGVSGSRIKGKRATAFYVLFEAIKRKVGTYDATVDKIGLNHNVITTLHRDNEISARNARRILDTFNAMKK